MNYNMHQLSSQNSSKEFSESNESSEYSEHSESSEYSESGESEISMSCENESSESSETISSDVMRALLKSDTMIYLRLSNAVTTVTKKKQNLLHTCTNLCEAFLKVLPK
jgi:hypothetical protein